jgi:cell division protein FtsB
MTDANRLSPEDRLERIESLMIQLGTISQARGQMTDDHGDRIQQMEQLNLRLSEIALQHESRMERLESLIAQHEPRMERLEEISAQHQAQMASLNASNERLDRIIDYLIRRDGSQPE